MFHLRQVRRLSNFPYLCNLVEAPGAIYEKTASGCLIEPVIGLEVHTQLKLNSKLFSQGGNDPLAPPNTQIDLLDVSLPGTLPKLNLNAIKLAIYSALGFNCSIQDAIHFDRKNYFYADMPAGYQITQYNQPIAKDGYMDFIVSSYHNSLIAHSQSYDLTKCIFKNQRRACEEFEPYLKRSRIRQIQLEQDSAKTLHQLDAAGQEMCNLIDYNRSGSALIEIVFEPDLSNSQEASSLVRELIKLLRVLDACSCELQTGALRVDANVSIRSIDNQPIEPERARRVELKNLNSLRSLHRGISSELKRQAKEIMQGNRITQESRSFDSRSGETVPLRLKEDSIDYRYIPDPNLPPLTIERSMVEELRTKLPRHEFPCSIRDRLRRVYKLDYILIAELCDEPGLSDYFDEIMKSMDNDDELVADNVADFLIYLVANLKRLDGLPIEISLRDRQGEFWTQFSPSLMKTLFEMIFNDEMSFDSTLDVMKYMMFSNNQVDLKQIIRDLNLNLITDSDEIKRACDKVLTMMRKTSKRYYKTGDRATLKRILEKLSDENKNRISVRKAIECINKRREENIAALQQQQPA